MVGIINAVTGALGLLYWPEIHGIYVFNVLVLTITPTVAIYGIRYVSLQFETCICAALYFFVTTFGITAGYHRLWSHRSYKASFPLQVFLLVAGAGAVQGSCFWWARRHRSHHRHTDTDRDPYNAKRGLLWTHIGWMLFKTNLRSGEADISDLKSDFLVQWQHRNYMYIQFIIGYVLPTIVPGILWGDWLGGLCYVCALRMTICHHSVFCVNSIAHYLGDTTFDDRLSPRDNFFAAVITVGEGYHNYHHEFPMDYRNGVRWYQFDPTKWFIASCGLVGLATKLKTFPENEIEKSALHMRLKYLKTVQDSLEWPTESTKLPRITWDTFQELSKTRVLLLLSGFIHDVSSFVDEHPGGRTLLTHSSGKDVTAAFFGGVYDHSNAAQNLLAMKRVGVLIGAVDCLSSCGVDKSIPPAQTLYVATVNRREA